MKKTFDLTNFNRLFNKLLDTDSAETEFINLDDPEYEKQISKFLSVLSDKINEKLAEYNKSQTEAKVDIKEEIPAWFTENIWIKATNAGTVGTNLERLYGYLTGFKQVKNEDGTISNLAEVFWLKDVESKTKSTVSFKLIEPVGFNILDKNVYSKLLGKRLDYNKNRVELISLVEVDEYNPSLWINGKLLQDLCWRNGEFVNCMVDNKNILHVLFEAN